VDNAKTQEEAKKYALDRGLKCPVSAYKRHKQSALKRNIGWEFTFDTWWEIWKPYFHLRNNGTNGLCMGRHQDVGPYSPSNVYLTTILGNILDASKSPVAIKRRQFIKEEKERKFARSPANWTGQRQSIKSQVTYVSNHTVKSTCNYRDPDLT